MKIGDMIYRRTNLPLNEFSGTVTINGETCGLSRQYVIDQ